MNEKTCKPYLTLIKPQRFAFNFETSFADEDFTLKLSKIAGFVVYRKRSHRHDIEK